MMVLVPELIIYDNLIKLFNFVSLDFAAHPGAEDKTILWHIFQKDVNDMDLTFNKTDYYQQAKNILILRNNDSPRKIEVGMGFNMERASLPTIHIMMPTETPGVSPIGTNQGYRPGIGGDTAQDVYNVFTVGFSAQYSLIITSDNSLEVLLIYIMLKSGFIGLKTQMELAGFQNVTFGGSDLMFSQEFMPQNVYSRNFNLNFNYDFGGRDIFAIKLPTSVSVTSQMNGGN